MYEETVESYDKAVDAMLDWEEELRKVIAKMPQIHIGLGKILENNFPVFVLEDFYRDDKQKENIKTILGYLQYDLSGNITNKLLDVIQKEYKWK